MFYNATNAAVTVPAGKIFSDAQGVQITYDTAVTIPAASGSTPGQRAVPARAVDAGINGDIAANDIAQSCCAAGISVKNTDKFSGGQDTQYYAVVQQSDIDGAAKTLEASLTQSAQTALQSQLAANERFISPAQCSSNVTSNVSAGSKVTNVTVAVAVNCEGEVYNQRAVKTMVAVLLSREAEANLGAHYALVGNVVAEVTQAAVIDTSQGTTALLVKAEGVWVYRFSPAETRELVRMILGKSRQGAVNILLKQAGVANIAMQVSSNYGTTLPSNPGLIKIVVRSVPGVRSGRS